MRISKFSWIQILICIIVVSVTTLYVSSLHQPTFSKDKETKKQEITQEKLDKAINFTHKLMKKRLNELEQEMKFLAKDSREEDVFKALSELYEKDEKIKLLSVQAIDLIDAMAAIRICRSEQGITEEEEKEFEKFLKEVMEKAKEK